jgi:hypothetical protein
MSQEMGRRTLIKDVASTFSGLTTAPLLGAGHPCAGTEKNPVVSPRDLG